jgi:hypothetical protein
VFVFAQGAEHAAAEARAVAHDNARAEPLFISGATGQYAAYINGVLEPTEEKGLDGRALYRKRGDGSVCMEHFGGQWQVKPVSDKGKNICWAVVVGGCAAEACTSRPWRVWDGEAFYEAPLVKMVARFRRVRRTLEQLQLLHLYDGLVAQVRATRFSAACLMLHPVRDAFARRTWTTKSSVI